MSGRVYEGWTLFQSRIHTIVGEMGTMTVHQFSTVRARTIVTVSLCELDMCWARVFTSEISHCYTKKAPEGAFFVGVPKWNRTTISNLGGSRSVHWTTGTSAWPDGVVQKLVWILACYLQCLERTRTSTPASSSVSNLGGVGGNSTKFGGIRRNSKQNL